MKKTRRSAFTIVELVIVIAVIAILSAVLIPTFGSIIKSANVASDQTTAANLTTELHIWLKGDTIDSEAELMAAINAIDPEGKKLVPKAAAYGNHFWFDMDSQMIIAKTAAEIETLVAEKGTESASVNNGIALINDVQAVAETASINVNFRSLLGGGYYLVDKGGSAFVDVLNTIADFDCTKTHAELVDLVNQKFIDFPKEDETFVEKFKTILASAVIITEEGVAQPATASYVYFEPDIRFVNAHGTISSITTGNVDLPSTVIGVAPGSLLFGGEVVLNTACKDASDVEFIFANASTNATIKTATESYKIADGEGIVTTVETEGKLANKLVPVSTISEGKGTVVEGITLSNKLEVDDFEIYVAAGVPGDNTIVYNNSTDIPTLYVSHNDFAKTGKEIILNLVANNGETYIDGAHSAITWNFNGLNTYTVSLENATESVTVTASARNVNGVLITKTLNIVVVKPSNATFDIGGNIVDVPYDGLGQYIEWNYNGAEGADVKNVTFDVSYNSEFANGTPVIDIDFNGYDNVFTFENGKIALAKNEDGTIALAKDEETGATITSYVFTISVDDVISGEVNVTVNDYTNARLVAKFNHVSDTTRPYYIGNGEVTLGHILRLKNENDLPYDSKVVILARTADGYADITRMEFDEFEATVTGTPFTSESWDDVKINFTSKLDKNAEVAIPIQILITPSATSESALTTAVINLVYINATNVDSVSGLGLAATEDVVLMSNIDITSNSTKITVGEAVTLYGNGFIINAPTYKAETTGATNVSKIKYSFSQKKYCYTEGKTVAVATICELRGHNVGLISTKETTSNGTYTAHKANETLITLDGGTIDNIYINGPVYPELQYYADDSTTGAGTVATGYYVSGIKVTSTGTIQNSYVSGFRQPVSAQGTSLRVDNSTLEGGNYANLQLVSGTLNLNNVTTVQDPDGMEATVDNIGKLVIGLGVAVESTALQSAINITGYLNQYNWVPETTDAVLPTISGINLDEIFGYAFNGVMNMKISRFLVHIHEDESNTKYFNAGFIFANIGGTEEINAIPDFKKPNETNRNLASGQGFTTGSTTGKASDTTGTSLAKITVRLTELSGKTAIDSFVSGKFGNADGIVYIYSYVDGRVWDYSNDTVDEAASALKDVVVLSDEDGSVHPITYKGYYTNYGK